LLCPSIVLIKEEFCHRSQSTLLQLLALLSRAIRLSGSLGVLLQVSLTIQLHGSRRVKIKNMGRLQLFTLFTERKQRAIFDFNADFGEISI